jgi:mannosyltransferase
MRKAGFSVGYRKAISDFLPPAMPSRAAPTASDRIEETAAHDVRQVEVIVANLKRRFSGVTSTVLALLPVQSNRVRIAALGPNLPRHWPRVTWGELIRHGWQLPPGRPFRIWHARRNIEMLTGLVLRSVLRMPLKLVFTSAAQRRRSTWSRFLLARMDAVIAASPEAESYLEVPCTVVLHGVDTARYRPAADRDAQWAATGLPGKFGIGVFGRVRAQKGTDRFVHAMCRLLPRYPDFTAVIVGAITPDQRAFGGALRAKISAARLGDRILFLDELPADEVPAWLRRVTIVVGPQIWEGFGLVPLEAMASGAAVVATRVGAARHLIVEGETGFVVDADDMAGLEARIESLMRDPAAAAAMGRRGRAHVEQRFSIEREAAGIQAIYDRLWGVLPGGRERPGHR